MRPLRRRLLLVVAALTTVCLTAACSVVTRVGGANAKTYPKKDVVLVASVINTTNPYMVSMIQGAKALSKRLGVPLKIVDSQGSSQTEISKIQAILAQGKKVALMVNTVASSDAPTIVNAVKAAGGYVTIWWNKPDSFEPARVGNNFAAFQKFPGVVSGECTGKALAEGIGKKGDIIALAGVLDSTTSQTRVAGLKQALKAYPGVHLLDVQAGNWDPQVAFGVTQSLISKYGKKIDGVWAADDAMILGATEAMKKAGRFDQVKFASDGLYPPVVKLMKDHAGNDAVVGETFHRGYMASAIGLYTSYLAVTGKINPAKLPRDKRDSLFKLACVTPANLAEYSRYDDDIDGWVDTMVEKGPWNTAPAQLVGAGPEKLPR
ncbi:sugar ABC transporter substrate-binding protein [Nocardioides mangrovicus]|uniref:Sugar ABC transporter substrate-binding protein n=1 Tax=Nocardioides mangrovicus TaxID=2478913 RepID=A0A3L8P6V1_9ACTN|nr:sugar ABC transporter substrate-binding protein [Nocardioides mangrovicus]RLV50935.1 sugar ABC transporter substrate-binding protein [Nocardioides mangrovicus]